MSVIAAAAVGLTALAAVAPIARADDKPAIAVIGVMAKDTELARAADAMTTALRAQAGRKTSGYKLKGTKKQIDTAILSAECSSIQPTCAAGLGSALSADYTIAGELERRGTHEVLVLSLVDVHAKTRLRAVREVAALKADAKKLARAAYTRLIGGDTGSLSIVANAQNGDVLIDGQSMAALFEGKATIEGLVNGTHQLSIRAAGYRPFDLEVTVEYATKETVLLDTQEPD